MKNNNKLTDIDFIVLDDVIKSILSENNTMMKLLDKNTIYENSIKKISNILKENNKSVVGLTNNSKYSESIICKLDYISDDIESLLEKIKSNDEIIRAINKAIGYNNSEINKQISKYHKTGSIMIAKPSGKIIVSNSVVNVPIDISIIDKIKTIENDYSKKCKICTLNEYCEMKNKSNDFIIENCSVSTITFK